MALLGKRFFVTEVRIIQAGIVYPCHPLANVLPQIRGGQKVAYRIKIPVRYLIQVVAITPTNTPPPTTLGYHNVLKSNYVVKSGFGRRVDSDLIS